MFVFLLVLAVLSVIAMIVGVVWTLISVGQTHSRSGPDVGAEIIAERMEDESDDGLVIAGHTAFKGKAVAVGAEAEFSLAEIKQVVKAGKWREAFPILLAIAGLLGLLLFGSLALLAGVENKLVGGIVVVIAMYALIRTLVSILRA